MKTYPVDLTADDIDKLLKVLVPEAEALNLRIQRLRSARNDTSSSNGHSQIPLLAPSSSSGGKRAKKGESERVIRDLLKSLDGESVAAKEIANVSHTKYGSTIRILRKLKSDGFAVCRKRLWRLAKSDFAVASNVAR